MAPVITWMRNSMNNAASMGKRVLLDPKQEYRKLKKENDKIETLGRLASSAISIIGIAAAAWGTLKMLLGHQKSGIKTIVFFSLPLCYLGYNCDALLTNIKKIEENRHLYFSKSAISNKPALKQQLREGTFCLGFFTNWLIDKVDPYLK